MIDVYPCDCGAPMVLHHSNDLYQCLNEECGHGSPYMLELDRSDFLRIPERLSEKLLCDWAITFCDECGSAYHYRGNEQWLCWDCDPEYDPEEHD